MEKDGDKGKKKELEHKGNGDKGKMKELKPRDPMLTMEKELHTKLHQDMAADGFHSLSKPNSKKDDDSKAADGFHSLSLVSRPNLEEDGDSKAADGFKELKFKGLFDEEEQELRTSMLLEDKGLHTKLHDAIIVHGFEMTYRNKHLKRVLRMKIEKGLFDEDLFVKLLTDENHCLALAYISNCLEEPLKSLLCFTRSILGEQIFYKVYIRDGRCAKTTDMHEYLKPMVKFIGENSSDELSLTLRMKDITFAMNSNSDETLHKTNFARRCIISEADINYIVNEVKQCKSVTKYNEAWVEGEQLLMDAFALASMRRRRRKASQNEVTGS